MFGQRYFGNRYFGGHYWGHVGSTVSVRARLCIDAYVVNNCAIDAYQPAQLSIDAAVLPCIDE